MQASSPTFQTRNSGAAQAIFWGGLIAGVLDLIYAIGFNSLRGVRPLIVPQAIASGLLGVQSFQGGLPTAILGIALEFFITFVAAAIYFAASRKLAFLVQRAVTWGLLYGIAIYFFMNFIVVPLSAAPKFKHTPLSLGCDFLVHMLFIGLPMALAARRFSTRE